MLVFRKKYPLDDYVAEVIMANVSDPVGIAIDIDICLPVSNQHSQAWHKGKIIILTILCIEFDSNKLIY
jgi:hypothetical protein